MKSDNYFVRLGHVCIRYPKTVLLAIMMVYALVLMQLPHLRVDTSTESFLMEDAKPLLDYNLFRKEFGRDEFFVVVITGVDVFSLDFLGVLRDFHAALETHVDKLQSVESLVNVRSIYGEEDELVAEDLLENFPETADDLEVIKQRIRGKDIYYGRLLNKEEDTVALFVKLVPYVLAKNPDNTETMVNLSDAEVAHGSDQIKAVVEQFSSRLKGAGVHVGGTPELGSYMSTVIQRDFGLFTTCAVLMVALVLGILFKRWSGVFIPLLVMGFGISSTIAMMPVFDYPMQITTSILPCFLLAVCVGDSVHILSIFYKCFDAGASKEEALLSAMHHTGIAVLFTSLTTAAGLLSFCISDIQPIVSLGLFSAIGSIVAFLLTITLVPVFIILLPVKRLLPKVSQGLKKGSLPYKFTRMSIFLSTRHPKKIVFVSAIILLVTLILIPQLRFSQDSLKWFPEDNSVRIAVKVIEQKITGSMPLEIVIDTGKDQGALDPQFLQSVDRWLQTLQGKSILGLRIIAVNSLIDLVKETHQAFNGNEAAGYIIPDDQELIAQELLLVEMDQADDLYQYTDKNFRKLRITLIMPWADAVVFEEFQEILAASYYQMMGEQYAMHFTGIIPIFSTMFSAMLDSATKSYLLSTLVVGLLMIIMLRNVVDGLLSMLPNFLPIMMVIAFMAAADIPMDVFTVLIGSIAMGLCVDDTIHFMHGFKTAYAEHGDAAKAIDDTLMITGKALMITSVVLFWSFMTYTLSALSSMDNFGILTAMCIVLALIFDFLLAPALMILRYGKGKQ